MNLEHAYLSPQHSTSIGHPPFHQLAGLIGFVPGKKSLWKKCHSNYDVGFMEISLFILYFLLSSRRASSDYGEGKSDFGIGAFSGLYGGKS